MTSAKGAPTASQTPQILDDSPGESLKPSHARRLRIVHRSAGRPCCDPVEVDLVAAGLLERRRTTLGHETVHVTEKGLPYATLSNIGRTPCAREALNQRVAREMTRNGRLAWCNLRLRIKLAGDDGIEARWCVARPYVFSIRNTSVEGYAQPLVHHVIVDRVDLVAHQGTADAHAAYGELGGECWYVLSNDAHGVPVAAPDEIPKEYGILVHDGGRLVVARSAAHGARTRMPFTVWMALAKSQPIRGLDEGVQGLLCGAEIPFE